MSHIHPSVDVSGNYKDSYWSFFNFFSNQENSDTIEPFDFNQKVIIKDYSNIDKDDKEDSVLINDSDLENSVEDSDSEEVNESEEDDNVEVNEYEEDDNVEVNKEEEDDNEKEVPYVYVVKNWSDDQFYSNDYNNIQKYIQKYISDTVNKHSDQYNIYIDNEFMEETTIYGFKKNCILTHDKIIGKVSYDIIPILC